MLVRLKWILMPIVLVGFLGCAATENAYVSVKNYTQGEYYLKNEQYEDCIVKFRGEVNRYPSDAKAQFYLGRCYLAMDKNRSALTHLKKAVVIDPRNPDYHFWQGVAYAANGKTRSEQKSYEDALSIKKDHVQALVYMGHNRFEAGQFRVALSYYNTALRKEPDIPQALYNRGLALRKLNRTPEEIRAWKTYLAAYRNGNFAISATQYLNKYGQFDYRNHTLGKKTLTLRRIEFAPSSPRILKVSIPSLNDLARVTARNPKLVLHIVAYQKNNRKLAELRAKRIKIFLLDQERGISSRRIKVSWFNRPEMVKIGPQTYRLDSAVNFFGQAGS